jgi:hypothetical protein
MPYRHIRSALLALAALLVFAAPASADFSVDSFTAAPASAQAGGHSDFTASFEFGGDEKVKDLALELPPGLVGNPKSAATCTVAQFTGDNCPAASEVGTTTVEATAIVIIIPTPITATGTIYNLAPEAGEPARLGILVRPLGGLLGNIPLQSPIKLRSTGDFGLTSLVPNMPSTVSGLDTTINAISLTLNATAANGPFMTNPTSCDAAKTVLKATSEDGTVATATSSFTPTDCAGVPFTPTVGVTPGTTQVDTPTDYSIAVNVPDSGAGRAQSHVSRVAITTPPGTNMNAPVGDGLDPCTEAAFNKGSDAAPVCPAASKVGTAQIDTPLLGVLEGDVFLAQPTQADPFRIFVSIPLPGGRIKLIGKISPDANTGQLTSVFDGLPPVPFTSFKLTFRGGDKAVLVNDTACATQTTTSSLTPYSGASPATPTSQFTTTADGAGAACADPQPFAPRLTATSSNTVAGASPKVTMDIARDPGQQLLTGMEISLPAGLVGGVNGIGICAGEAATTGNCPAESKVGTASTIAGAGGSPLRLGGTIYLATGDAGAPAALLTVVPARVGPYDFGNVVLKSNIHVRPGDAGFEVSAPSLPQILGGIPLRLRGLSLTLDRDGFMRNPTNCAPLQIEARFTSAGGARSSATAPYQSTGCDSLVFAPRLTASAGGKGQTAKLRYPGLTTIISQAPTEGASKSVAVTLPKELSANRDVLGAVCQPQQLEANACPAASRVGEAQANTSLLPLPLTGNVYIVANPAGLPKLAVDLKGLLSLRLIGEVQATTSNITTTFTGIPDVPLTRFALRFFPGPKGMLQNGFDLCTAKKPELGGTFVSHAGTSKSVKTPLVVEGCPPSMTVALRSVARGKPSVRIMVRKPANGNKITQLRLRLPKGMTFSKKQLRKGASVTVGRKRVSSKNIKLVGSKELWITVSGGGADAVRVALSKGLVRSGKSLRKAVRRRPSLSFSLRASLGTEVHTIKKSVRAR